MNYKQLNVVLNSKIGSRMTPAQRMRFMETCSFCESCGTGYILESLKEYISEAKVFS